MKRLEVQITFVLLLFASLIMAQNSSNMNLLGSYDDNTLPTHNGVQYNDVWGYSNASGEFAVVGNSEYILFLNVTDPSNITSILEFDAGNPEVWRDFKHYQGYIFGVCDSCSEGLHIFSTSGATVTHELTTTEFFSKAHNIFIDEAHGVLYAVGVSGTTDLIMIDITDPENPSLIKNVNFGSGFYVHDVFVKDSVAYCSHGYDDFYVWDLHDPNTPVELGNISTPNYNHSSWISEDGAYCYYAEEVPTGMPMTVVDLANLGDPVGDLGIVGTFSDALETSGDPTPHNPYVIGDLLVISYYEDGVKVYDISNPAIPVLAGYYDTYSDNMGGYNGYEGCWGVFPFLPSGNILASDITYGLHVLEYVPEATCSDGMKNGSELGVDCGGPDCDPCAEFCYKYVDVDFENGWEEWIDGGIDCRKSKHDIAYANSGTKCIRLRDNTSESTITSPVYDLTDSDLVTIYFNYISDGFESGEDLWLQVSTDGGATFTTEFSYVNGTDFSNGVREFEVESLSMAFSNQTVFRFRADASDNGDKIYIDDVAIERCPTSCTVINQNDWEVGLLGWKDDGIDCRRKIADAPYANSGSYCIRIQDDTDASSITSPEFELDGAQSVEIDFNFIALSMEPGEDFWIQYSLDGGSTYTTAVSFVSGVDFDNDVREFKSVSFYAPFTDQTKFKFRCDASVNTDRIFLDDVTISACGADTEAIIDNEIEEASLYSDNEDEVSVRIDTNKISLFPNPVQSGNDMNIFVPSNQGISEFVVYDVSGARKVKQIVTKDQELYQIDLSTYTNGTYFVHLISDGDVRTERFILID